MTDEKQKISKKKMLVWLLPLLVIVGLASAALVGYLSNTITTEVEVTSPMLQEISMDGTNWNGETNTINLETTGGGTIEFYTKTTNLANVPITGIVKNIVTNEGITCSDFVSVKATTTTNAGTPDGPYDLIALNLCSLGEDNNVVFSYGPNPIVWTEGQVDITKIEATFKTDALGSYTFTSEVVPVPQ